MLDWELLALLERAKSIRPTPQQIREQRRAWVAAEMAIGDDSDEAAYAAAVLANDSAEIDRLHADGERRRLAALELMSKNGW